ALGGSSTLLPSLISSGSGWWGVADASGGGARVSIRHVFFSPKSIFLGGRETDFQFSFFRSNIFFAGGQRNLTACENKL
ncbi:Os12g0285100, partial [Oryza sativa Japonica Group]